MVLLQPAWWRRVLLLLLLLQKRLMVVEQRQHRQAERCAAKRRATRLNPLLRACGETRRRPPRSSRCPCKRLASALAGASECYREQIMLTGTFVTDLSRPRGVPIGSQSKWRVIRSALVEQT